MTIVGFERQKNGSRNLLVFDPMFRDASSVVRLIGKKFNHRYPDTALKSYRRGNKYLKRFREFEMLKLVLPSPISTLALPYSWPSKNNRLGDNS